MDGVDNFLNIIEQGESSGRNDPEHKKIKHGIQAGTAAIGRYGLMPNTIDELITRAGRGGDVTPEMEDLKDMNPGEKREYLAANPIVQKQLSRQLASTLLQKHGGDQEKAAFAWNHGHNLTTKQIEDRDYQDSDYVKKFNKIADKLNKKTTSEKYTPPNFPTPADKPTPLDMSGTPEGEDIEDYVNKLGSKDIMQQHYSSQNDKLKKYIADRMVQPEDNVMHSEMGNQKDSDPMPSYMNNPNSLKFGDNQPVNPSLIDNAKEAVNLYDTQVANRPRAAAMATLKGQNPINAAIDNKFTSGEDIAKEGFKTLNPQVTQTTNPYSVLMKQGAALAPAAPIVGAGINAGLDPMTYAGGAIGALKRMAPITEAIPAAEQTAGYMSKLRKLIPVADDAASVRDRNEKLPSRSFLQKTGPTAPNLTSRAEKLAYMDNEAKTARFKSNESYKANPHSDQTKLDNARAFKAEDDFEKAKAILGNGYSEGGVVQPNIFGSLGYNQDPSYASQNISPDVSQTLNANEANIDSQQAAKQARVDKLMVSSTQLTPEIQKIAEGMGGMGSIKAVASKTLPLAERVVSNPRIQQFITMQDAAKEARDVANALWDKAAYSKDAIFANAKALKLEDAFKKASDMYHGQGFYEGGIVKPGMGDVKQSDRDFDLLTRQLDAAKEGTDQFPNITKAFGGDAEKIYRSQPENFGNNVDRDRESRMPDEYAYGNIFKQAKSELSGQSPNYLPSPYKSPDIEADAFNKDYMRNLRQSPESTDQDYTQMKHSAQDIAANAYDKDILKSKDFKDYLNKLQEEENTNSPIIIDPHMNKLEDLYGEFNSKTNSIRLGDESKGTAMHEIGHAKLHQSPNSKKSYGENDYTYDEDLLRNKDILRNYLPQLKLRGEEADPGFDDNKSRKHLMNRAIDEGRAQLISDAGSSGHHAGYTNYPIDRTLDEYKNRLDQQGFNRTPPESDPKFERVRSLIDTIRNINKK
jgi:hypothetical protein